MSNLCPFCEILLYTVYKRIDIETGTKLLNVLALKLSAKDCIVVAPFYITGGC